jgi:dihydrofolate reductase
MSRVIADITMSLDGFVAAPGADLEHGLGIGGDGIHGWVLEQPRSAIDQAVLDRAFDDTGAVVMGRRLFDIVDGPDGWDDNVGYGHDQDQSVAPPCFVVTHEPPQHWRLGPRFRFVTGGVDAAVEQARAAAGERNVTVMGGADVINQCFTSGLVDELRLHVSPLLVGGGARLFAGVGATTLVQRDVVVSPRATHFTYDVTTPR